MVAGGDWSIGLWLDRDNQSVLPGQDTAVMSTNGTPIHSPPMDTTQNRYLVRRTSLSSDSRHWLASGQAGMNAAQRMIDLEGQPCKTFNTPAL